MDEVFEMDYITKYYSNNAKELHKMVNQIIRRFGGIYQKDIDDFYSLANEVFVDVLKRYDSDKNFDTFLYSCLLRKIKTEMTRRNRKKRKTDRNICSLDIKVGDNELSILEMIPSKDSVEDDVICKGNNVYSDKTMTYLNRLSLLQVSILELLSDGYKPREIQRILHINENEYRDHLLVIYSFENIKYLQYGGI